LLLLRKLGFKNVLVVICIWHYKVSGTFGISIYQKVIDESKELLKVWFKREYKSEVKAQRNKSCMRVINLKNIGENSLSVGRLFIPQKNRLMFLNNRSNMLRKKNELVISAEIPELNGKSML